MSRAAIVIAVNRPRGLAPLSGAVSDAVAFAAWIESKRQGFEVELLIDQGSKVTLAQVFSSVERIVNAQTYSQLVVYFAGHGFQNGGSEVWLLSDAPNNPTEAISLEASVMAARESGLKSVVFISDACRSIPAGMQNNRVDGGAIFPNAPLNRPTRPEVDRIFATLPSLVAVEAAQAGDATRNNGIFTREFIRGYRDPPAEFVETVPDGDGLIEVVTNRKLKGIVRDRVENAAFAVAPQSAQLPEFILESVTAYVGRVERTLVLHEPRIRDYTIAICNGHSSDHTQPRRPHRSSETSIAAIAHAAISAANSSGGVAAAAREAQKLDQDFGFSRNIDRFSVAVPDNHPGLRAGFSVSGARIIKANSPQLFDIPIRDGIVCLHASGARQESTSVLIQFDGGTGTVLPGIDGYFGHVFVENGVVTNVNYAPARENDLWEVYDNQRNRLEALRATVAAAARLGVFRIAANEARSFADKIRILKAIDPTLGLYAAYAYASAGLVNEVASVLDYMRDDLRFELFDVAMLARRGVVPSEAPAGGRAMPILPFCPMLRQGWALLPVRDAKLARVIESAHQWLLPGLWTTFAPEGVDFLRQVIDDGILL